MKRYYDLRASEYEEIYSRPERQRDLARMNSLLKGIFTQRRVIEVACGTGYWTQRIAESAESIWAIDQSEPSLEIAKSRSVLCKVEFEIDDAYVLAKAPGSFNAGFSAFWLSHVPRGRLLEFLRTLHSRLRSRSKVVFIDNNFVDGGSTPISRTDEEGNTYQNRKLSSGQEFEVLKNFHSDEYLSEQFSQVGSAVEINRLEYYWIVEYELP